MLKESTEDSFEANGWNFTHCNLVHTMYISFSYKAYIDLVQKQYIKGGGGTVGPEANVMFSFSLQ